MSFAMNAYARSPVWLQNFLISAYGVRLRRLRYGRVGQQTLAHLRQSHGMPAPELLRQQLQTLSQVVARAAGDVPFYRSRGLQQMEFDALGQLDEVPLLDKSEAQAAGREMISDRYRGRRLTEIHTGGTTG